MQLISTNAPHGGFSIVAAVFKNGIIIDIIIAVMYNVHYCNYNYKVHYNVLEYVHNFECKSLFI